MAFHIRPDESIIHGLKRLARKELASARDGLERSQNPGEDEIHEARKSVKKVRALVRVIRDDNGHGLAGTTKRLRAVNRVLSEARDADAMKETLAKLLLRRPRMLSEHTRRRVRLELSRHRDTVARTADRHDAWDEVVDELRTVRAAVKRWSPAHRRFGTLAQGLRKTHKAGRKAMVRALESRRAADFHEWRKQMKALRYELRLMEDAGPKIQTDVTQLDKAETALGDDHNVTVLLAYLSDTHCAAYDASEWQRLRRYAERYQQSRRREAIARAEAIYKTPTEAYVRRIKQSWRRWKRRSRAGNAADRSIIRRRASVR